MRCTDTEAAPAAEFQERIRRSTSGEGEDEEALTGVPQMDMEADIPQRIGRSSLNVMEHISSKISEGSTGT